MKARAVAAVLSTVALSALVGAVVPAASDAKGPKLRCHPAYGTGYNTLYCDLAQFCHDRTILAVQSEFLASAVVVTDDRVGTRGKLYGLRFRPCHDAGKRTTTQALVFVDEAGATTTVKTLPSTTTYNASLPKWSDSVASVCALTNSRSGSLYLSVTTTWKAKRHGHITEHGDYQYGQRFSTKVRGKSSANFKSKKVALTCPPASTP